MLSNSWIFIVVQVEIVCVFSKFPIISLEKCDWLFHTIMHDKWELKFPREFNRLQSRWNWRTDFQNAATDYNCKSICTCILHFPVEQITNSCLRNCTPANQNTQTYNTRYQHELRSHWLFYSAVLWMKAINCNSVIIRWYLKITGIILTREIQSLAWRCPH